MKKRYIKINFFFLKKLSPIFIKESNKLVKILDLQFLMDLDVLRDTEHELTIFGWNDVLSIYLRVQPKFCGSCTSRRKHRISWNLIVRSSLTNLCWLDFGKQVMLLLNTFLEIWDFYISIISLILICNLVIMK